MITIHFILVLLATICFFLAAIGRPATSFNLGWAGAFCLSLDLLLSIT